MHYLFIGRQSFGNFGNLLGSVVLFLSNIQKKNIASFSMKGMFDQNTVVVVVVMFLSGGGILPQKLIFLSYIRHIL